MHTFQTLGAAILLFINHGYAQIGGASCEQPYIQMWQSACQFNLCRGPWVLETGSVVNFALHQYCDHPSAYPACGSCERSVWNSAPYGCCSSSDPASCLARVARAKCGSSSTSSGSPGSSGSSGTSSGSSGSDTGSSGSSSSGDTSGSSSGSSSGSTGTANSGLSTSTGTAGSASATTSRSLATTVESNGHLALVAITWLFLMAQV